MKSYPPNRNLRKPRKSSNSREVTGAPKWVLIGVSVITGSIVMSVMMFIGCGHTAQVSGVTDAGSGWFTKSDDPTPGIHKAQVSMITLFSGPEEGVKFVVWSDMSGKTGAGGTNSGYASFNAKRGNANRGASYVGRHTAPDREAVGFEAETKDGVTGTIQFGETTYDFANGKLFLVSSQQQPAEILQLNIDTADIPNEMEPLMEFAKVNEPIEAFFKNHKPLGADDE